jgi:hypothetical protein
MASPRSSPLACSRISTHPAMKQLAFLGECFKRTSNSADSIYGAIYRARKALVSSATPLASTPSARRRSAPARPRFGPSPSRASFPMATSSAKPPTMREKMFLSHLHAVIF